MSAENWIIVIASITAFVVFGCSQQAAQLVPPSHHGEVFDGAGNPIVGQEVELFTSEVAIDLEKSPLSLPGGATLFVKSSQQGLYAISPEANGLEQATVWLAMVKPGSQRRTFVLSAPFQFGPDKKLPRLEFWEGAKVTVDPLESRIKIRWDKQPVTKPVVVVLESGNTVVWRQVVNADQLEIPITVLPPSVTAPSITLFTTDGNGRSYGQYLGDVQVQNSTGTLLSMQPGVVVSDAVETPLPTLIDGDLKTPGPAVTSILVDLQQPIRLTAIVLYRLALSSGQSEPKIEIRAGSNLNNSDEWVSLGEKKPSGDSTESWWVIDDFSEPNTFYRYVSVTIRNCAESCADRFTLAEIALFGGEQ